MINDKKYIEGFTLVELLTNITIVSALTFSMMFVFYQIQKDFDIETNRTEIINYSNRVLDDVCDELMAAYETRTRKILNTTSLQLLYNEMIHAGLDYFDLSSHLSYNECRVQQSAREFVDNEILPCTLQGIVGFDSCQVSKHSNSWRRNFT